MKRKRLPFPALLMAVLMTLSIGIASVRADETAVAAIGETQYDTLQEAFDAAVAGDTVTLLKNVILSETLSITNKTGLTFDLGSYMVSDNFTTGSMFPLIMVKKSELTIMGNDGHISVADSYALKQDEGHVTILAGVTVEAEESAWYTDSSSIGSSAVLTVDGGILKAVRKTVNHHGNDTDKVIVKNGEIMATEGNAIEMSAIWGATLTIEGGEVYAPYGAAVYSWRSCGTYLTITSGDISGSECIDCMDLRRASITGGFFQGAVYTPNRTKYITGGTFVNTLDASYIADGYSQFVVDGHVGPTGVYIQLTPESATYNGTDQQPQIKATIPDGTNVTTIADIQWTKDGVPVSELVDTGVYTVTAVYEDYEGSANFTITPADVSSWQLADVGPLPFTGYPYTTFGPVTMSHGSEQVTLQPEAYEVEFTSDHTEPGTVTFTLSPTGNYTGSISSSCTIRKGQFSAIVFEASPQTVYQNPFDLEVALTPDVIGTLTTEAAPYTGNQQLVYQVSMEDYSLMYRNNTAPGEASVVVSCANTTRWNAGTSRTVYFTIEGPLDVDYVDVQPEFLTLGEGESYALTATVYPEGTYYTDVVWESGDPTTVAVDENGVVTALRIGRVLVQATTVQGGQTSSCMVTVVHRHALSAVEEVVAGCEEDGNLAYWICDQGDYACGKLFLDENGTTETTLEEVTLEAQGHIWGEWEVTQQPTYDAEGVETRTCQRDTSHTETRPVPRLVYVSEITVTPATASVDEGSTLELIAAALPEEAANKAVVWSSSDETIATVDENGTVTGIKYGSAVITATAADGSGVTGSSAVTVIHHHALRKQTGYAPTCTETGRIDYWICDQGDHACGRLFLDESGAQEITADDTVIPASGHQWDEGFITTHATCTEAGEVTYHCLVCETARVEQLAPMGHSWTEWQVTVTATTEAEGEESRVCRYDQSHAETRIIPKIDPDNVSYRCVSGEDTVWYIGSPNQIYFEFIRSYEPRSISSYFTGIKIDGEVTDSYSSSWSPESKAIILQPQYLDTLTAGSHTITAVFSDGEASAAFEITSAPEGITEVAAGWSHGEPEAYWYQGPNSTHHYELWAVKKNTDGTEVVSEKATKSAGSSLNYYDFDEFVAVNGSGIYVFNIRAIDSDGQIVGIGQSEETGFWKLTITVINLDNEGNTTETPGGWVVYGCDNTGYGTEKSASLYHIAAEGNVEITAVNKSFEFVSIQIDDQQHSSERKLTFPFEQDTEVTVTFRQDLTLVPITLQMGDCGDNLVQALVTRINEDNPEAGAVADGTDITLQVYRVQSVGDTLDELREALDSLLWSVSDIPAGCSGLIATREDIHSYATYMEAYNEKDITDPVTSGQTFYLLWGTPVTAISGTVTPPLCGHSMDYNDATGITNRPEAVFTEDSHTTAGGYWMKDGSIYINQPFVAGETYTAYLMIDPAFGYYYPEEMPIEINGQSATLDKMYGQISVSVDVTAIHDWGQPQWTWSEDHSSASASFVCQSDPEHTATVEAEVTREQSGNSYVYTAVAALDGTEYTDTWQSDADFPDRKPELTVTAMSIGGIELGWTDISATRYDLYKGGSKLTEVTETAYTDSKVKMGTTYTYKVRGYTSDGKKYSRYSDTVKVMFNPFTDVDPDSSYFKAVAWAYNNKIVGGKSETTFEPDVACTRAQFCVMLWKVYGRPSSSKKMPFTDLGQYADSNVEKAIRWAYGKGIIRGFKEADGTYTFRPDDNISREQMAIMLWRAAGKPSVKISNAFADISTLGTTSRKAISWCAAKGVSKGVVHEDGKTYFEYQNNCTRAQLCIFMQRFNKYKK